MSWWSRSGAINWWISARGKSFVNGCGASQSAGINGLSNYCILRDLPQGRIHPIKYPVRIRSRALLYARANVAHQQQLDSLRYTYKTSQISVARTRNNLPCTPSLYDAGKESLLRIIRNIWSKAIDNSSKMTIEALQNLRSCHPRFERLKDFGQ
jgi:hypothetical protein